MADNLKPVTIHWEEIEKYNVFKIARLEVKCDGELVGYYRIWDDPNTNNIAFYGAAGDRRGVLPPQEYKAQANNHKLIRYIEKDLESVGYYIPDGHRMITDYMLVGKERFPKDWDLLY